MQTHERIQKPEVLPRPAEQHTPRPEQQAGHPAHRLQRSAGNRYVQAKFARQIVSSTEATNFHEAPSVIHHLRRFPEQSPYAARRARLGAVFASQQASSAIPERSSLSLSPGLLQHKLIVGQSNDTFEQKADRMAEFVVLIPEPADLAAEVTNRSGEDFTISSATPRIQRLSGDPTGQSDVLPTSVEQALPGHGTGPAAPTRGQQAQSADTSGAGSSGPKLYGLLSRSISGPLRFSPWALGAQQELSVGISSPLMSATGAVIADASVPAAEYEIGFVQALIAFKFTATYTDGNGRAVQYLHIGVRKAPIRDGRAGSKPWSKQEDVKSLDANDGYIVNTKDRPFTPVPWRTPDRSGSLSSAEGMDYFCTWLAARHKPSGQMFYLGWGTWTVDWGSAFDAASETGRCTGAGGKEAHSGDKKGPVTPLEGDPVANDSMTVQWSATP